MRSDRFPRLLLLILIGGLLTLLIGVLSVGVERRAVVPSSRGLITKADIDIDDFSLRRMHDGALEWDVRAKRAMLFEGRQEASLNDIQATLWTSEGMQVRFSGDEAMLDTRSHNFEIKKNSGDLSVWISSGYTVRAPSLKWREERGEILSDQPAQIAGQGLRIRGGRFVLKLDNQQLTIVDGAHVTVEP